MNLCAVIGSCTHFTKFMYDLTWFSDVTTFDLAASRAILLLAFLIIFDNSLQNLLCHILIFMIAIFIDVYYYYGVKTHCKTIFDRFKFSYSCQSKLHSNLSSFKMLSFVILFPEFFYIVVCFIPFETGTSLNSFNEGCFS